MAKIPLQRTSTIPNAKPTTEQIELGEISVNTKDGKVFFAKSGTTKTVEELISTNATNIGNVTIQGNVTATTFFGNLSGTSLNSENAYLLDGHDNTYFATVTSGNTFNGNQEINGSLLLKPITGTTSNDIDGGIIYVDEDKNINFKTVKNGIEDNIKLKWLEGNLYSGILSGGLISVTNGTTTFNISAGTGLIVTLNADLINDFDTSIKYVTWDDINNIELTYLTTYIQSYIAIDENGDVIQSATPFNNNQYNTLLTLGTVLHQDKTVINASITYPNVAYGYKQRTYDFIKAFGHLKLEGFSIIPSGTLGLNIGAGTAWAEGRNYQNNPNNPNYINDTGTTVSKIFRYYQISGTTFSIDTNNSVGYTELNPTQYNLNGTLTSVPGTGANRKWSIQRIFWYPNSASKGIVVYYGNKTYNTAQEAASNNQYEEFFEQENTKQNAIYLGALALRNNANFTDTSSYLLLPAGIFRNVGGGAGGGNIITSRLQDLSDVTLSTLNNSDLIYYDTTLEEWVNGKSLTGNFSITGDLNVTGNITGIIHYSGLTDIPSTIVTGSTQIFLTGTTGFSTYINQPILTTSNVIFSGVTNNGIYYTNEDSTRDKIRLWTDNLSLIGMESNYNFGPLDYDYAMTFQMANDSTKGFWWGDSGHNTEQGAMALSTDGKLTIASSLRLGYGESDIIKPGTTHMFDVNGNGKLNSLFLGVNAITQGYIKLYNSSGSKDGNIYNDNTNGGLHLDTLDNLYPIQIDGSKTVLGITGNVLIGTQTDFGVRLYVSGDTTISTTLIVNSGATIHGLTIGRGSGNISFNTAIGVNALFANTTGTTNTAIGYNTLSGNTIGINNTGVGSNSLRSNIGGSYNTGLGSDSLYSNTSGTYNTALGYGALHLNTTGTYNTALGSEALYNSLGGGDNIAIGRRALYNNNDGTNNIALGSFSQFSGSTSSAYNISIGRQSSYLNVVGQYNVAVGYQALYSNLNFYNVAIGYQALRYNTSGGYNVAIGYNAGLAATSGNNVISNNSIFIGNYANPSATNQSNQIVIGYNVFGLGSNTTVLGNSSTTLTALYGNLVLGTTTSTGYKLEVNGTTIITSSTYLATASGNVGIGTTTANKKLEIYGGNGVGIRLTNSSSTTWDILNNTSSSLDFVYSGTTTYLKINGTNGYVGINNTSPSYQLDVIGSGRFAGNLIIANGSTPINLITNDGTDTYFNSGNIGFGLTTPTVSFDVNGRARFRSSIELENNNYLVFNSYFESGVGWKYRTNGFAGNFHMNTSGDLVFTTVSSGTTNSTLLFDTKLQVMNNGNVLIGTTTDIGYKLDVIGTIRTTGYTRLATANGTVQIGSNSISSETVSLKVGYQRQSSGYANIDLIGDNTFQEFGLRISRGNTGANATSSIEHIGTGSLMISAVGGGGIRFYPSGGSEKMVMSGSGNFGIGLTSPQVLLHTNSSAYPSKSQFKITANSLGSYSIFNFSSDNVATGYDADYNNDVWVARHNTTSLIYKISSKLHITGDNSLSIDSSFTPTNRFTLDLVTGHIGIGLSEPTQRLDVFGAINSKNAILLNITTNINTLIGNADYVGYFLTNTPNDSGYVMIKSITNGTDRIFQTAYDQTSTGNLYTRHSNDSGTTWSSWKTIINSDSVNGTTNYISKFNTNNSLSNSQIFDNGTNIGFATTSPTRKLDIDGDLRVRGGIEIPKNISILFNNYFSSTIKYRENGYAGDFTQNSIGDFVFSTSPTGTANNIVTFTERFIIKNFGTVGIGISSPTRKLDINGDLRVRGIIEIPTSSQILINSYINGTYLYRQDGYAGYFIQNSTGDFSFNTASSGTTNGTITFTERFLIKNNGNVLIGTSTDDGYKLSVVGDINAIDYYGSNVYLPNRGIIYIKDTSGTYQPFLNGRTLANSTLIYGGTGGLLMYVNDGSITSMQLVNNGNVLIGTTTDNGYKLAVNGTLNVDGIFYRNGEANLYGLTGDVYANIRVLQNVSNTVQDGLYINYNSTGGPDAHIRFYANGLTERMRIDASNGNVGIGTTYPDVFSRGYNGKILGISSTGQSSIGINSGTGYGAYFDLGVNNVRVLTIFSDTSSSEITTITNTPLTFGTNSITRLTISSTGNVGIGTTSPSSPFHLQKGSAGDVIAKILNSDGFGLRITAQTGGLGSNTSIGSASGESISFSPNNTEAMRIIASGYVGIGDGTTTPLTQLHIYQTITNAQPLLRLETIGTNGRPYIDFKAEGSNLGYIGWGGSGSNIMYMFNYNNTSIAFGTNSITRLIVSGNGNVIVGSSSDAGYKLDVQGDLRTTSNHINQGYLQVTNGIISSDNSRIINPQGASYITTTQTITGAFKIKLPVAKLNSDTMMRMTIKIYTYEAGRSYTIDVGGYNYNNGAWYSPFAINTTDNGSNFNVRFGNDSTSNCIWIGEVDTIWAYPQVFVTDFQGAFTNYDANWLIGWSITPVTSFDTVSITRTAAYTLNSTNSPYAFNLNQNLRTTDSPTFSTITGTLYGSIYGPGSSFIQSTSVGTSYSAHYQIREKLGGNGNSSFTYAPAIGFHWANVVASSIAIESSGRIAIMDNAGTSYESFIANNIYFNNYLYGNSKEVFNTTDTYLRLNQSGSFTSGIYTPGALLVDGLVRFSNRLTVGTTTDAGFTLDVNGTTRFSTSSSQVAIFNSSSGSYGYMTWQNNGTSIGDIGSGNNVVSGGASGDFGITSRGGGFVIGTNSLPRLNITNGGAFGINTTTPIGMIDVKLTTNQHIQFVANVNGTYSGASGIVCVNDANSGYTPLGFYSSNFYFGGGAVGIGTTSASYGLLHIIKASTYTSESSSAIAINSTDATGATELLLGTDNANLVSYIQAASRATSYGRNLSLQPNGGNVGIGTSSPTQKLHVVGGNVITSGWVTTAILQASFPILTFNSTYNSKYGGIGYDGSSGMNFWVHGSSEDIIATAIQALYINSSNGYIGIGTSGASKRLTLASPSGDYGQYIYGEASTGNSFGLLIDAGYNSSDFSLRVRGRVGTEFLSVRGDGYVGIGTSTPTSTLTVAGSITMGLSTVFVDTRLYLFASSGTLGNYGQLFCSNGNIHLDSGTGSYGLYLNYYNGVNGIFFGNGATGYNARVSSDGKYFGSQYYLNAMNIAPASSTDTGTTGEIRYTSTYIYLCTSTNNWVRAAFSSF